LLWQGPLPPKGNLGARHFQPRTSQSSRRVSAKPLSLLAQAPRWRLPPAPGPLSGAGSAPFPVTAAGSNQEGSAAMSARNPGTAEVRATYAAVVSDSPSSIHPSGTLKPTANGSASSDPAASSEADTRRMSVCDMPGPLRGLPVGATIPNPQPANPSVVTPGERRNRTPIYITGVSDTRGFLAWLRSR
jgi:hypothetical protein